MSKFITGAKRPLMSESLKPVDGGVSIDESLDKKTRKKILDLVTEYMEGARENPKDENYTAPQLAEQIFFLFDT